MKHLTTGGEPAPDDFATARKKAIVEALVNEALSDDGYCEALMVAAFNVLGYRSVMNSVPLDAALGRARAIAEEARDYAARTVLQ